jgi:hypothetical protein
MNFPGNEGGDMSWEIRALKNGASQAAEAWKKIHDASGGLNEMVDLWRHLADVADEFGAQLNDIAHRIDTLGVQVATAEATEQPEG